MFVNDGWSPILHDNFDQAIGARRSHRRRFKNQTVHAWSAVKSAMLGFATMVADHRARSRQRRILSRFDDRMLKDIGASPRDARNEGDIRGWNSLQPWL